MKTNSNTRFKVSTQVCWLEIPNFDCLIQIGKTLSSSFKIYSEGQTHTHTHAHTHTHTHTHTCHKTQKMTSSKLNTRNLNVSHQISCPGSHIVLGNGNIPDRRIVFLSTVILHKHCNFSV